MNRYLLSQIPILRLVLPLSAGILFAKPFGSPTQLQIWTGITILFFCLAFFQFILYKRKYRFRYRWVSGAIVFCFIFSIGAILQIWTDERFKPSYFQKISSDYLHVKIIGQPQLKKNGILFQVNVLNAVRNDSLLPVSGNLLVYLGDTSQVGSLYYGDELLIKSNLAEISPALNPYQFNYKNYMANKQIFHQSYIRKWEMKKLGKNSGNPIIYESMRLRDYCILLYKKYLLNDESVSLASTLVLGYRADLSDDIVQAYQDTGTTHILSVSGLHVGIIFIMLNYLLSFMIKIKYGYILRAALLIIAVWFYAIISGLSPAVNRAAVMLSFIILGLATRRSSNIFNTIAISALLLLLYDPNYLFDVGFQLSYIALSGIIYFQPKFQELYTPSNWFARQTWILITVSVAAQLVTFPLSIYYFHQFPIYFLVSNLVVIPLATMVLYGGVFVLFANPFIWIAEKIGFLLHYIIIFMNYLLATIGNLPGAVSRAIWFSTPQFYLLSFSIILLILFIETRKNKYILQIMACLVVIVGIGVFNSIRNSITQKAVFHSSDKGLIVSVINGNQGVVISKTTIDKKEINFLTANLFNHYGISKPDFIENDTSFNNLFIAENYLQLNNTFIFCLQKNKENIPIAGCDYIFLEKMKIANALELIKKCKSKTLIVDKRYDIEEEKMIEEMLKIKNLKVHFLSKGAFTIEL